MTLLPGITGLWSKVVTTTVPVPKTCGGFPWRRCPCTVCSWSIISLRTLSFRHWLIPAIFLAGYRLTWGGLTFERIGIVAGDIALKNRSQWLSLPAESSGGDFFIALFVQIQNHNHHNLPIVYMAQRSGDDRIVIECAADNQLALHLDGYSGATYTTTIDNFFLEGGGVHLAVRLENGRVEIFRDGELIQRQQGVQPARRVRELNRVGRAANSEGVATDLADGELLVWGLVFSRQLPDHNTVQQLARGESHDQWPAVDLLGPRVRKYGLPGYLSVDGGLLEGGRQWLDIPPRVSGGDLFISANIRVEGHTQGNLPLLYMASEDGDQRIELLKTPNEQLLIQFDTDLHTKFSHVVDGYFNRTRTHVQSLLQQDQNHPLSSLIRARTQHLAVTLKDQHLRVVQEWPAVQRASTGSSPPTPGKGH